MKKLLLLGVGLFALVACEKKETPKGSLHLTGNIKGLSQGKLYLKKIEDTTFVTLDSIIIKGNSNFESTVKLKSPEVLYLFLDRGQTNSIDNSLPFFAEPGEMNIDANLKEFYASAKVTGSKNHELLTEFNSYRTKFNEQSLKLVEKKIKEGFNLSEKTADSINDAYQKILTRKYRYTANFAATHGDFEIAPYLALTEIGDINIAYLDTIAKHLTPKITNSKYGKLLTKHIKDRKQNEK
ncbi:hypothetical protein SY27_16995 [Flavobacterium sp. 316]|uniref:DUF4369 domain-containing protein n=1 Tax=Flavobacterium sp. 316 TaxID=1603293 RepID=UPI0005DAD2D0|nr:DUF4369 domain-containing protein [Flavobacterium sp. 316]KIX19757.1 hypothetical protein SY27_16995 [Flavobacterium sp. 316]